MIWECALRNSSGVSALTVAAVPTGIKVGVSTIPCVSLNVPRRALRSRTCTLNTGLLTEVTTSLLQRRTQAADRLETPFRARCLDDETIGAMHAALGPQAENADHFYRRQDR